MGLPRQPNPVKLFVALLYNDSALVAPVERSLAGLFKAVDTASELLPWNVTNYYAAEMGALLWRKFVSFEDLVEPSGLAEIKLCTQELETKYRWRSGDREGRRVNLDPGYLEASKIVLASTKNAGHRVYLKAGIYAEAALQFHRGSFEAFPYTYPDYRWPETLCFFHALRSRYLEQLRAARPDAG
jgi:hypothetical protein